MPIADKLILGINTTVIGMGIVFIVLISLQLLLVLQAKLLECKQTDRENYYKKSPASANTSGSIPATLPISDKTGNTAGEVVLSGIEDDETAALIMSVVSCEADIPLSQLKFNHIKAV